MSTVAITLVVGAISPLYLPYISPTSPLSLPYISPAMSTVAITLVVGVPMTKPGEGYG
jgi:hypothetical protein